MDPLKHLVLLMFALFCRSGALDNQLKITSLPDTYCQLNVNSNTFAGPLTVFGDPYRSCDVKIQSINTSKVLLSIKTDNITATGTDYIYVERLGSIEQCSHRYVAFRHPMQTCNPYFWHNTIHLHFRGNFSISIDANKTLPADGTFRCPEDIGLEVMANQAPDCEMKGYELVTHCIKTVYWWKEAVECYLQCPDNCSCILGNREVLYGCPRSNNPHQVENTILIYPSDIGLYDNGIEFDFSWNGLTTLMPDSFITIAQHMSSLRINNNKLVSLSSGSFNGLHELVSLLLYNNHLESLPTDIFDGLQKLDTLNMNNNKLLSLTPDLFNGLHVLDGLSLERNYLESLPADLFNGLNKLKFLSLEDNNLVSVPQELFNGLRDGLHNMISLYLGINYLESLPANLFNSLSKLQVLSLKNNHLVSLPSGLFNGLHDLVGLSLQMNRLESLPADIFNALNNLLWLRLENNHLVSLPASLFKGLHELFRLYLNNNHLESLPEDLFSELHNVGWIRLEYNNLVSLQIGVFNGLDKLNSLTMRNNRLVSLPLGLLNSLHELKSLYLDNNYLESVPAGLFNDLDSLETLNFENNSLVSLSTGLFLNALNNLVFLDLTGNKLKFLSFHLFDNLVNLKLLDLSDNRLTHIPRLGRMTRLNILNLIGNPLTGITSDHFDRIPETATIVVDQPVVCVCYMNSSATCFNTKERSSYLTCNTLLSMTILSIFTWILGICATLGNGFVLSWKQSKYGGRENNVQSILLRNLAASDLLMGIYMVMIASADTYYREYYPMNAEEWRTGVICRIASTLAFTSSEASVFFVTLISFDRFINIKFPYTIRKLRAKSARWSSSIVWAISLMLGLSASISAGRDPEFYDNSHVCIGLPLAQLVRYDTKNTSVETGVTWTSDYAYPEYGTVNVVTNEQRSPGLYFSVAVFIGLNMLCFLLILSCYVVIIKTVSEASKAASRQREVAEEIRMTVKVSAIVLTDFFCWFPICLIGALVQAGVVTIPPDTFAWVVTFVLPINSAINPFMYTIGTLISDKCGKKPSPTSQVQTQSTSQYTSAEDNLQMPELYH